MSHRSDVELFMRIAGQAVRDLPFLPPVDPPVGREIEVDLRDALLDFAGDVRRHVAVLKRFLGTEEAALRTRFIGSEFAEFMEALAAQDVVAVADALADIEYVVAGTEAGWGLPRSTWDEVQRSNMAKFVPCPSPHPSGAGPCPKCNGFSRVPLMKDGKVMKPDGWRPPDIARILARELGLEVSDKAQLDQNVEGMPHVCHQSYEKGDGTTGAPRVAFGRTAEEAMTAGVRNAARWPVGTDVPHWAQAGEAGPPVA